MATKQDKIENVPIRAIRPTKENPRGEINTAGENFKKLLASIKGAGVKIPVIVRPLNGAGKFFELLAGFRRFTAAKTAGLATLPAIVKTGINDSEAFNITFTENYAREDLTTLEQSRAVDQLLARFKGDTGQVCEKLGWTFGQVLRFAHLKNLSPRIKKLMADRSSEFSQATAAQLELIARLPINTQETVAREMENIFIDWNDNPRTVADTKKQLDRYTLLLSGAAWDLAAAGVAKKIACNKCQERSDYKNLLPLFHEDRVGKPDVKPDGVRCLNTPCWADKMAAVMKVKRAAALKEYSDLAVAIDYSAASYSERSAIEKKEGDNVGQVENAKVGSAKPGEGRKPIFILNGPAAGTVRHIKIGSTPAKPGRKGKTDFTPLKDRHKNLESKRWTETIARLAKKVTALDFKASGLTVSVVYRMAAIFGQPDRLTDCWRVPKAWIKLDEIKENQAAPALFNGVRDILVLRLGYNGGVTQLPAEMKREAKRQADLFKFDLTAIFNQVSKDKGFTVPASWAKLNADGSPRQASQASGKKAAKTAKKAKKKGVK